MLALTLIIAIMAIAVAPALASQYNLQYNGLFAGKSNYLRQISCGSISTQIVGSNLVVAIYTSGFGDWVIKESHIAVGTSVNDFPMNNAGNPKVGNFPYAHQYSTGVTVEVYSIPLSSIHGWTSPNTPICIAYHAIVVSPTQGQETAWGDCGTPKGQFPGNNWATFYWYYPLNPA